VKIALAQINFHIGNFQSNTQKVKNAIQQAKNQNTDLIVFAELAISGYPPRDFLEFDDFIKKCHQSALDIASECYGIAAIIGCPVKNPEFKGKDLYNAALFLEQGKIKFAQHKTLLPNYDIFDEYRYFEPNTQFNLIEYKGYKFALTICEDLWNIGDDLLYRSNPMDELYKLHPDVIINIAASPFHYNQAEIRGRILKQNVSKYKLPLFYVNHVGAQTELLFDGGSMAMNSEGKLAGELAFFKEDLAFFDLEKMESSGYEGQTNSRHPWKIALIHDALVMGVKNYFGKLGFEKAILGLSGGIDSAVTLVLAARALGNKNVKAVLLPSRFSSDHSVNDAVGLAKNLGVPYELINIEEAFKSFEKTMEPHFRDTSFNLAEENIQARVRGVILMALSNKFGYILLNTSNKSEAAVGYGTLYGDMNGGLSVLGDVYKTEVFELARYINDAKEIIPENTITKPPSAELRPDQKDSDSLPDYEILDNILYQYIELRQGPEDLIKKGFEESIVRETLKLVNTNEYKRYQTPPILRVSPKAFGMGRRMPIVAKYLA